MKSKKLSLVMALAFATTMIQPGIVFAAASTAPSADGIAIVNKVTDKDTITVSDLAAGTVVKVYSASTGGTALGTATVAAGATSAVVSVAQLGKTAGNAYVSVTKTGETESTRTEKAFDAEPLTDAPSEDVITTENNAVVADIVKVTGLAVGDIVKVYDKNDATKKLLGTATVATGKTEVSISIPKFPAASGNLYVSLTTKGKLESSLTTEAYVAEATTDAPSADNITPTNTIKADSVKVTGLAAGDILTVYDKNDSTKKILGKATVAAGKTEATIAIAQLGKAEGKIYVSATTPKKLESTLVEKSFAAEPVSDPAVADNITTVNNAVVADTVTITGLAAGDIVKVYNANDATKKVIGTATVLAGKTEAVVNVPKFPAASGKVYVAVTSKDKLESTLVEKAYVEEVATTAPSVTEENNQITITNTIKTDTVKVTGLTTGDIVKVYNSNESTKKVIGTIIVAKDKTEANVVIPQLGKASGKVYVTVTTPKKLESTLVEKAFAAEPVTELSESVTITTVNNAVIADSVKVTGLTAGDIVKVYNSNEATKKVIGTATVAKDKTEVTVSVPKFPAASGNVYIGVTSKDKLESSLAEKAYAAEAKTDSLSADNILIVNNTAPDAILVLGVAEGDMINVYNAATEGKVVGKATVGKGMKMALINVPQLGAEEGKAYLTITKKGKLESDRVEKAYAAE